MNEKNDVPLLNEEIQTKLEDIEKIRIEKKETIAKRIRFSLIISIILMPLFIYLDVSTFLNPHNSNTGFTILYIVILFFWVTAPGSAYKKAYKQVIFPEIAKFLGEFRYIHSPSIDLNEHKNSFILPYFDYSNVDDEFIGLYDNRSIHVFELELKSGRDTAFQGLLIKVDLSDLKVFGHTILLEGHYSKPTFGQSTHKLKKVNLIDPEFDQIFNIYSNDQVEARYILDPKVIEELKSFKKKYDSEKICLALYDKRLLVTVKTKSKYFEPMSVKYPSISPENFISFRNDMKGIFKIVDSLSFLK